MLYDKIATRVRHCNPFVPTVCLGMGRQAAGNRALMILLVRLLLDFRLKSIDRRKGSYFGLFFVFLLSFHPVSHLRTIEMKLDDLAFRRISSHTGNALAQGFPGRIKEWLLSEYRRPLALSRCWIIASWNCSMGHDAVIPECNTARLPLPPHGKIVSCVEMLAQEAQSVDAFLALKLGYVDDERGVIEK